MGTSHCLLRSVKLRIGEGWGVAALQAQADAHQVGTRKITRVVNRNRELRLHGVDVCTPNEARMLCEVALLSSALQDFLPSP